MILSLTRSVLLLSVLSVSAATAFAQASYPVKDSVNLRNRDRMRQYSYENHLTAFPAPRRNNWSVGLQGGYSMLSADIRSEMGWGLGLNVRRALGHTLSLRAAASFGTATGQNWRPNGGFIKNPALNGTADPGVNYLGTGYPFVFYNYKMNYADANLQAVFSLNNINFYNKEPRWNLLGYAGVGMMMYYTRTDALDAGGNEYDYSLVPRSQTLTDRKSILSDLNGIMDGTYETNSETHAHVRKVGDYTLRPTMVFGIGASYKVSRRIDLALEHRVTWTNDDLLDGQRWEETLTLTSNFDLPQWTTLGINFRIGKGEESYWWSNPLNHPYEEIRNLGLYQTRDSKDSDGDGVPDSRDKELMSPQGARVDMNGVSLDSDGDSYPDYRDKEPFSPKGAQVDKNGVALDSDGDGVADIFDKEPNTAADAQADAEGVTIKGGGSSAPVSGDGSALLPMVNFDFSKADIKQEFYPSLYYVARFMKRNPDYRLKVVGHADARDTKGKNMELSLSRAQNVVDFLVTQLGIDRSRFDIEGKAAQMPLVQVDEKDPKSEGFFYMNRRVEFEVIRP